MTSLEVHNTVFSTSKICAIKKMKKEVPLQRSFGMVIIAQMKIAFDRQKNQTTVRLLLPDRSDH
jgi:hypothetical protein